MELTTLPLAANLGIFAASAALVWLAGVRIARWADALAAATGIGSAVLGLVLLGGITSLPEVAVSITASVRGDAALAANNLLGGLALQVTIIAVADMFVGRNALSSVNAEPVVLLQASVDALMLTVVAIGIAIGEMALPGGFGAWSLSLVVVYAVAIVMIGRFRGEASWHPADHGAGAGERPVDAGEDEDDADAGAGSASSHSVPALLVRLAVAAVVILAAGAATTVSAEAIAEQTGLGTSFVGAVLLACATSLPEVSTALEAVRLRRYTMAFADVFGTNLIDVALLFLIDVVSSGPPVIGELGAFSQVAALMGVVLTMIYVVGLIERRDRVVLRMGYDSALVIALYCGGLFILYRMR